jgi:hypothetical protein
MHHRLIHSMASLACLSLSMGCGGGLQVRLVNAVTDKPSNVAMFFTVDTKGGEPVGGLAVENFVIYEDGALVSQAESKQTIINPEVAAEHFTLLLVDMSGSVTESDDVHLIAEAATRFTAALEGEQRVAVYAFDGSEEIFEIQSFVRHTGEGQARGVSRLGSFRTKDPSTNLNGALVKAAELTEQAMAMSEAPLTFGTVVVFTDGTDRAARVSSRDMQRALGKSGLEVFAIGVGSEIDEKTLSDIGLSGYVLIGDLEGVVTAFETISQRIIGLTKRFYLLSYCSPARAGTHKVTVEVQHEALRGSASYEFDATGFGPNCDPNRIPDFGEGPGVSQGGRGRSGKATRIRVE